MSPHWRWAEIQEILLIILYLPRRHIFGLLIILYVMPYDHNLQIYWPQVNMLLGVVIYDLFSIYKICIRHNPVNHLGTMATQCRGVDHIDHILRNFVIISINKSFAISNLFHLSMIWKISFKSSLIILQTLWRKWGRIHSNVRSSSLQRKKSVWRNRDLPKISSLTNRRWRESGIAKIILTKFRQWRFARSVTELTKMAWDVPFII